MSNCNNTILTMNKISNILILWGILLLILLPTTWYLKNEATESAHIFDPITSSSSYDNDLPGYSFQSTSAMRDYHWDKNTTYYSASSSIQPLREGIDFYVPSLVSNRKFESYTPNPIVSNLDGATQYANHFQNESDATSQSAYANAIQAQALAMTAQAYSAAYIPFGNTTPSEVTAQIIDNQTQPAAIRGRQNGFPHPSDPDQSKESPVGEPWIMLIFAVIAAATITLLKRLQKTQA